MQTRSDGRRLPGYIRASNVPGFESHFPPFPPLKTARLSCSKTAVMWEISDREIRSRRYFRKPANINITGISLDPDPAHRIVSVLDGPSKRPLLLENSWGLNWYFPPNFFQKEWNYKLSFRCTSSIDDSDNSPFNFFSASSRFIFPCRTRAARS